MLIADEQFMRSLVRKYGKRLVSTDGGGTWYPSIHPQACKLLKLKHHYIHSSFEKSIIERTSNMLKIELKVSMTTFHAEKKRPV
jgi:hypothetical protein